MVGFPTPTFRNSDSFRFKCLLLFPHMLNASVFVGIDFKVIMVHIMDTRSKYIINTLIIIFFSQMSINTSRNVDI